MLYTVVVTDRIIVDSRTLRGAHFQFMNDFLGGIHLEKRLIECGYTLYDDTGFSMCVCVEPGILLELIEERLAEKIFNNTRQFLLEWKEQISENDNSYVILGKTKK